MAKTIQRAMRCYWAREEARRRQQMKLLKREAHHRHGIVFDEGITRVDLAATRRRGYYTMYEEQVCTGVQGAPSHRSVWVLFAWAGSASHPVGWAVEVVEGCGELWTVRECRARGAHAVQSFVCW